MNQKAIAISHEMITQRGYVLDSEHKLYDLYTKNSSYLILYKFVFDKISVKEFKTLLTFLNQFHLKNITNVILIYNYITPITKKYIKQYNSIQIELFQLKTLQYNITKHELVPHHELYTKPLLNINISKLPIMLTSDPVSKFYNFKRNDIIKITRKYGITYKRIK